VASNLHHHVKRAPESGAILVALLIFFVLMTLLGVWALSGSRGGMIRAGHYRGAVKIQYEAEEGVQRATRRIQEIADTILEDSLGDPPKDIGFLLGLCRTPVCPPSDTDCPAPDAGECTNPNPPCPEPFDAETGLDDATENVVCNFMGTALERTQVVLVRKQDFWEAGSKTAVFLLNSISRDDTGRRKIVQGVVVLPYTELGGVLSPVPGSPAYLATMSRAPGM